MWWSFYESDASFENFVIRALAYVSKRSIDEVIQIPAPERETQLLAALDHQPFLLVLDGLERILIAYARMDAARLDDSEVGREKNLRKTADPRVGRFLQKLAQVKQSRILVSSRLYPAELEAVGGDPIPGSFRIKIEGLTDADAVELWRAFGVSGSREELLPVFNTFAKHPLLIQALAGEIKRYRTAPGDFAEWRNANPKFDPSKFSKTKEAMAHVLECALLGLEKEGQKALQTIAAFRMPTRYDTLTAVLVGEDKPCANEPELDAVLNELEDRGLVGWDKRANRYDLHPIVRGVVWGGVDDDTRRGVFANLHAHFEAVPVIDDNKVRSLDDLTPAIEFYNTLIGLGRYDDAADLYHERLSNALSYRLSASRQDAELLEMLFADGFERPPRLKRPFDQALALDALGLACLHSGQVSRAVDFLEEYLAISRRLDNQREIAVGLGNLSCAMRLSGVLRKGKLAALDALSVSRRNNLGFEEAPILDWLGQTFATLGASSDARLCFYRNLRIIEQQGLAQHLGHAMANFAQSMLLLGDAAAAAKLADRAFEIATMVRDELSCVEATRAQGAAALGLNDFISADERLHHTLVRARMVNLIEGELRSLIALAELRRRQKDPKAAHDLLDNVWEPAERGPYPLFHADAFNVLAQIERDEGNNDAAIEAATKAYRLAWCDGPPFAYHWGLEKAKQHLRELRAPEPEMPPFDESKFEPMPEVEINPHDEFYVDEETIS
jgi:tetratricopeptide (TPR) repeat protein